jgi:hypothetical protein
MQRQFDSAITRVRPFFQPLLRRDPSGTGWLPVLLRLGQANPDFGDKIAGQCGPLLPWVSRTKARPDRALRQFGVAAVELEECFEHRLSPPEAFLRWLIEHPQSLAWPREEAGAIEGGSIHRRRRELAGHHGPEAAAVAQAEALAELSRVGAAGSNGKWWAFEGHTIADCLLETEHLLLLVEGKRTEPMSLTTRWCARRHQLLRNLEAVEAAALGRGREFAVLLMAEQYMSGPSLQDIMTGYEHLTPDHRSRLMNHYLGCVNWSEALARLFFPHTVADAAEAMRGARTMTAAG